VRWRSEVKESYGKERRYVRERMCVACSLLNSVSLVDTTSGNCGDSRQLGLCQGLSVAIVSSAAKPIIASSSAEQRLPPFVRRAFHSDACLGLKRCQPSRPLTANAFSA
jgi:hypothetical protein